MNLFDEIGRSVQIGDIIYINGSYTSLFGEKLVLYQGDKSIIKIVGKYTLPVNLH